MTPAEFRKIVWTHYKKHGRHDLPWRPPTLKLRKGKEDDTLYRILVSEIMLQQTQVERVLPFYKNFIKQFPTAKKLATAPLADVLKAWQGLGYNRRAKLLREAAQQLATTPPFATRLNLVKELEELPGVGSYTARAIAAFAYNIDVVVIETNIRTAVIQHFFPKKKKISDKEIERILIQALPIGKARPVRDRNSKSSGSSKASVSNGAREWYSALMDYGAHLKRTGISHNTKSNGYAKQSKFAGSLREARGAILREYTKGVMSHTHLTNLLGPSRKAQMRTALEALKREGLIT